MSYRFFSSFSRTARAVITGATFALLMGLTSSTVGAKVIYKDAFPGKVSDSVTTTNGFGLPAPPAAGPNWAITTDSSDATGWMANGQCNLDNYAGPKAFLPFVPVPGHIYTLSVRFGPVTAATKGHEGANPGLKYGYLSVEFTTYHGPAARMLDYSPGASNISILANNIRGNTGGVANGKLGGFGVLGYQGRQSTAGQKMQIVLDTTGPRWTVQFSDNGITAGNTTYTFSVNPSITGVGIGSLNGVGKASNFMLTDVTPRK